MNERNEHLKLRNASYIQEIISQCLLFYYLSLSLQMNHLVQMTECFFILYIAGEKLTQGSFRIYTSKNYCTLLITPCEGRNAIFYTLQAKNRHRDFANLHIKKNDCSLLIIWECSPRCFLVNVWFVAWVGGIIKWPP